jgi:hypothetical protein
LIEDNTLKVQDSALETRDVFTRLVNQPGLARVDGHLTTISPEEMIPEVARQSRPGAAVPLSQPSTALQSVMILSDTKGVDFGPYLQRIGDKTGTP